ncbi:hypothetical protein ANN_08624 [Periplaneta americana]|uniref:Uncharacterized protein n=1 Tax=Periplaneta americana TaxID=6978 RepID=A0ABQ8T2L0_PERAM|nr:hypothetical protein ANN_08624 [Periplaneta americana]
MSPGSSTESYSAFAHIGFRENPGKNLNQIHPVGLKPVNGTQIEGTILRKRLRLHPYLLQLLQAVIPEDKVLRRNFCTTLCPLVLRLAATVVGMDGDATACEESCLQSVYRLRVLGPLGGSALNLVRLQLECYGYQDESPSTFFAKAMRDIQTKAKCQDLDDVEHGRNYKILFFEIIDIIMQIDTRFEELEKLRFVSLAPNLTLTVGMMRFLHCKLAISAYSKGRSV